MAASDDRPPKPAPVSAPSSDKSAGIEGVRVVDAHPDPAVASEVAGDVGKLVKREVAAEMLGMPPTTFRRRVQNVELVPVMKGGQYFFREVEVVELAIRHRRERYVEGASAIPDDDLGKLTAIVFDLFDQGVAPVDVVKRLEKPAPTIETLHAQWVRMRGTVVLDGDQIRRLRSLDWTDREPMELTNGDKLVRFIENIHLAHAVDTKNCDRCRAARATFCASCYSLQIERIKAETRRYVEDAKTERAHRAFMRAPITTEPPRFVAKMLKDVEAEQRESDKRGRRR